MRADKIIYNGVSYVKSNLWRVNSWVEFCILRLNQYYSIFLHFLLQGMLLNDFSSHAPLKSVGNFFIGKTLFSVLIEWGILTFFHNMFQNATFGQIKKVWGGASSYIFSISYIGLFVNVSCKFWSLSFFRRPSATPRKGPFWAKNWQIFDIWF